MIKDLPKGLLSVVAEINKKSRVSFAEEQKALQEKMVAKQLAKMPMPAKPVSEPAAHKDAASMAKQNMKEAVKPHTIPKTAKEKSLAALAAPKDKITHADVMVGRGVKKEEVESDIKEAKMSHQAATTMKHIKNPTPGEKTAAQDIKPGIAGYRDRIAMLHSAKARGALKNEEAEQVDEQGGKVVPGSPFSKDYKPQGDKPGEKAGFTSKKISTGTVYSRKPAKDMKEATDTPGNSTHQCAIHVKSEQFGEGKTLFSQHAEPDADGNIAWYDVMFEHGIEKQVPTSALEVLMSESHMNHKKAKKEC